MSDKASLIQWQSMGNRGPGRWSHIQYFARICFDVDRALGEPAGCRYFLNFFDETPRDQMRRELLPEVWRELEKRQDKADQPTIV